MKRATLALSTFTLLAAIAAFAQSAGQKSFDTMKSLQGNWEGKTSMGDTAQVSFRLTANGSVLMSEIQNPMQGHAEDMVSMIHMDGNRLLLTHYCPTGNQPRMQASASPDGKSITFDFVDATNLASRDAGHMQGVVFTFVDANHHLEEWHYVDHGKTQVMRFDLQKKS
jgi:hypothetical protein